MGEEKKKRGENEIQRERRRLRLIWRKNAEFGRDSESKWMESYPRPCRLEMGKKIS